MTGPAPHRRKYDYAHVATVARDAFARGAPMGEAVAAALGCSIKTAGSTITRARSEGHHIPAPGRGYRPACSDLAELADQSGFFEGSELAACIGVDPELFFPDRGASTREAKEVCRGCVVREACLEYALTAVEKFGIWGGLSERERRRIRVARNRAERQAGAA